MRLGYLIACFVCLAFTQSQLTAQGWIKTHGGNGFEYGYRIAPMPDGGFITAGTQVTGAATSEDFWIMRLDSNGGRVWEKRYGRSGIAESLFGFLATHDFGFMVGGFTGQQFSGQEAATMYRGDSVGNTLWTVYVDNPRSDHWHFFVERSGGGYYMGGHTDSKGEGDGDMWLVKMDSSRNVIWDKTYGRGGEEHAHMGIGTRDGGCLLLGHADVGSLEKFWLVKVDANGNKQWDSIYSSSNQYHDSPYGLFENRDGNYVLVGGSSHATQQGLSRMWMLVVSPVGRVLSDHHYGNASAESFAWNAHQTSDGGYLVAGYTTFNTKGGADMYLVKTDSTGTQQWDSTIGGTGEDIAYDAIETPSGYVAAGSTNSPELMSGGGQGDMLVAKIARQRTSPPAAVVLVAPADGATGVATAPRLSWQSASGAASYQFQLAADSAFATLAANDSAFAPASHAVTGLLLNQRYWWRARGVNPVGPGAWSDVWSFTTAASGVASDAGTRVALSIAATPNPFVAWTTLRYAAPAGSRVAIDVIDVLGNTVRTIDAGTSSGIRSGVALDAAGLAAGTYIARLTALSPSGAREVAAIRMTLVR